ncbi:hypothetical protein [Arthrobacter sp. GMC3]|uniref:hypothetical protein n=1 Tax=Arthrobacter sp. GMC3 TaxID=2058894 RepID=UPI000CE3ADD0|nr:hypothetical protein [Arthrobacter sp. GMC3]
MFVLTIDQRGSRASQDRVPELLASLADIPTRLAFERTVGDEVQGLLEDPAAVVDVAMRALRTGHWHVGIGVGGVNSPLPARSHEAAGGAFIAAREAVEKAKKSGARVPLCVRGQTVPEAAAAEAVLVLIGDLVRKRSESEWRVVDALMANQNPLQTEVAHQLGISPQAVSKAILRSGWVEERNGALAAQILLSQADVPIVTGDHYAESQRH